MIEDDEPFYGESSASAWNKTERNHEILYLIYAGENANPIYKGTKFADAYNLSDIEQAVIKEISVDPWRAINR